MRIAVLGGGNGSFAAAGDMALAGHDVRLWRRDTEAVKAHGAAGGVIAVKDFRPEGPILSAQAEGLGKRGKGCLRP